MKETLPSPNTRRWVKSRKFQVVNAIRTGRLTREDAQTLYRISAEEMSSWMMLVDNFGVMGLRTTRVQDYRNQLREVA